METANLHNFFQMNFLRIVPLLSGLPQNLLAKMGDVLEQEVFKAGEYIVREGTAGDTFYILSDGEVRVTKRVNGTEESIRDLKKGDYFGEQVREITRDPLTQTL